MLKAYPKTATQVAAFLEQKQRNVLCPAKGFQVMPIAITGYSDSRQIWVWQEVLTELGT